MYYVCDLRWMLLPTQIEEVMQDSRKTKELAYLVIFWISHILLKSFT